MTDAIDSSSASPYAYTDTQPLNPYPPESPNSASAAAAYPFSFTGNAAEYFGIWIVNLLLNIITLGIYSPWAKVRKKRYFYGNTWVAESNFEYHGNPISILKGRIIAVIALAVYSAASYFSPKFGQIVFLILALLAPWFVVRSLMFNARNSSYRQIRFRFIATTREVFVAIWPVYLIPLISVFAPEIEGGNTKVNPTLLAWVLVPAVLTLFIYPYIIGVLQRLHVNNSLCGTTRFSISATIGSFYAIYIKSFLLIFGMAVVVGILVAIAIPAMKYMPLLGVVIVPMAFIGYFLFIAFLMAYLRSRSSNLIFNNTSLGRNVLFVSTLSARKLTRLYLVNIFAISFTFGLMVPWAHVRVAKYRAEHLSLNAHESFDHFVSGAGSEVDALGDQMGEFFDMDLSL